MSGNTPIYDPITRDLIGYRCKKQSITKERITRDLLWKTSWIVKNRGCIIDFFSGTGKNYDYENNLHLNPVIDLALRSWNKTPIYMVERNKKVYECLISNINSLKKEYGELNSLMTVTREDCNKILMNETNNLNKIIHSSKIKTIILDPCGWKEKQLLLNTMEELGKQKHLDIILTFPLGGINRVLGNYRSMGYNLKCFDNSFPKVMVDVLKEFSNNKINLRNIDYVNIYIMTLLCNYWKYIHINMAPNPIYCLIYCTNYGPFSKDIEDIISKHNIDLGKTIYKDSKGNKYSTQGKFDVEIYQKVVSLLLSKSIEPQC